MQTTPESINRLQQLQLLTGADPKSYLLGWHNIALDVTALDHAPTLNASPATFHQQFGPHRAARALALVHLAMFEAANRLTAGSYNSLLYGDNESPPPTGDAGSLAAAISEAAFQTLAWLYPGLTDTRIVPAKAEDKCSAQSNFSLREYIHCTQEEITKASNAASAASGQTLGREVAARVKTKYQGDGSAMQEPSWGTDFAPRTPPASGRLPITQWQIDPVSKLAVALGGRWSEVQPMALASSFQHRKPEAQSPLRLYGGKSPKEWDSYDALIEYAGEYRLSSAGLSDPSSSLPRDGFFVAQFWAYDATAGLCAPGRMYNQIADAVLRKLSSDAASIKPGSIDISKVEDVARYYAIINIAMNDAAIAAWDAKFYFQFPRPVTAIRSVDPTPPRVWYPVGAQVTNSEDGRNITPPFPAYPSGHATFGGALFGVLRQFVSDTSGFKFNYRSDEFNGKNKDAYNYVRCANSRENPDGSTGGKYAKFCAERELTFDCAERENADSRIFMGVHWIFDADDGIEMGNLVARDAFKKVLTRKAGANQTGLFSATPGKKRTDLLCANTSWPTGWEAKFGATAFVTPEIR
jgi:membrane-associated phospholipid phosphatase